MKANKICSKITKVILSLMFMVGFMIPTLTPVSAKSYEVVFRAGAHATFSDGSTKKVMDVEFGEQIPYDPYTENQLKIEDGYVFTGWSKEFPEKVEEKITLVAKCVPVVSGTQYTVRYVDQNDVDVATPFIALANKGTTVTVYAKQVNDWPVDASRKQLTINDDTNEIKFVYNVPEDEVQPEYITEVVTNVVDQVTTITEGGGTGAGGAAGAGGTAGTGTGAGGDAGTTTIDDNEVPQGDGTGDTTTIDDNETPLAKGEDSSNSNMMYIAGGATAVIILAIIAYILSKKKKGTE